MRSLDKIRPRGRKGLSALAATGVAVVLVVLYFSAAVTGEDHDVITVKVEGGKIAVPANKTPPPIVESTPVPSEPAVVPPEDAADPNKVHWTENGELKAPAPRDPAIRAAAIEQAIANGRSQAMGRAPDAQYAPTAGVPWGLP